MLSHRLLENLPKILVSIILYSDKKYHLKLIRKDQIEES